MNSVEMAKQGTLGPCFLAAVTVTPMDARFVPTNPANPPKGYILDPTVPQNIKNEFSSLEQAQAMKALIEFQYPGSELIIVDYGVDWNFPPFRKLEYFNDGSLYSPRLYGIRGSVKWQPDVVLMTSFSVGWSINVDRLIMGGSFQTQGLGFPFGNSMLRMINDLGGAQPVWVGGEKQ